MALGDAAALRVWADEHAPAPPQQPGPGGAQNAQLQLAALERQNDKLRLELGRQRRLADEAAAKAAEAESALEQIRAAFQRREDTLRAELGAARAAEAAAESAAREEAAAKDALARVYHEAEQEEEREGSSTQRLLQELQGRREAARARKQHLAKELRNLGALLKDVATQAKSYERRKKGLERQEKRSKAELREEVKRRARDVLDLESTVESSERDAEALDAEAARRAFQIKEELAQMEEHSRESLQRIREGEWATWATEENEMLEELQRLQNRAAHLRRERAESAEGRLEQRVADARNHLASLEEQLEEVHEQHKTELEARRKDARNKAAALEIAKGRAERGEASPDVPARDPRNMALWRRLKDEQKATYQLDNENGALAETVGKVAEKNQEVATASFILQRDAAESRGVREGAASEAPSMLGYRMTSRGIPTTATSANSSEPGTGSVDDGAPRRAHERLARELDIFVDDLDGIRRKLEGMEEAARRTEDPVFRDVLLQEMNALHRQALDDTLLLKRRRGGARRAKPGRQIGGMLRHAGICLASTEQELHGVRDAQPHARPFAEQRRR